MNLAATPLPPLPRRWLDAVTARPAPARGASILVAVSGGGDSVALLYLLDAVAPGHGWNLQVATLDHGLRGARGAHDQHFVVRLCQHLDLPCVTGQLDRGGVDQRSELACREARQQFLRNAAADCGATVIALAQTRDDQAETLLYRLARGAGTLGAGAIRRWDPPLWHPLLAISRRALRTWLRRARIDWCEDETNGTRHAARNRIRQLVLPALQHAIGRDPVGALARAAALAQEDEALLATWAETASARVLLAQGAHEFVIERKGLVRLPPPLARRILRAAFGTATGRSSSLGAAATEALLRLARAEGSGTHLDLPTGWTVDREGPVLVFRAHPSSTVAPEPAATTPRDQRPREEPSP